MRILALNAGSSSLKFGLFEAQAPSAIHELARGSVPVSGAAGSTHSQAISQIHAQISALPPPDTVAHRIVHGGPTLRQPAFIDAAVKQAIAAAAAFAPLHNPTALGVIEAAASFWSGLPAVAVFDTGFFATLPEPAALYPIESELAARHGIRRYGFHGLAHQYMSQRYAAVSGRGARLLTLQLGSGCSITALLDGHPIETSMGLTPLEGLMMETRSGDIDPSLVAYLAPLEGLSPSQVVELLNQRSGLLGIAGERDMERLLAAENGGDEKAALALAMWFHRIRKYIGAYVNLLGGVDALVFGGGIGENAPSIRARIADSLAWLGLELDETANGASRGENAPISSPTSSIEAWVVAVDEEKLLAIEALRLVAVTN